MSLKRINERNIKFEVKYNVILYGYKLKFNKKSKDGDKSYANIVKTDDMEDWLEGVVYVLHEKYIEILDKYEGFPSHYKKEYVDVEIDFGNLRLVKSVLTYIANEDMICEGLKPDVEYLSYIIDKKNKLSKPYMDYIMNEIKL